MEQSRFPLVFQEHVALAPYTSLGIGGPARYFAEAETEFHVIEALEFAEARRLPVFILGGGSNLVVSDAGYSGLILRIALRGISHRQDGIVAAAAGEDWDLFVHFCVTQNLAGIECLSGIPGTVGATPVQNVGAYGQEAGAAIISVKVWDRRRQKVVRLVSKECGFAYRTSVFNTSERQRYIILEVKYELRPGGRPLLSYPDLAGQFADQPMPPSLVAVRNAVLDIRRSKSMIVRPEDPDSRSAGSFFRNPFVPAAIAIRAEETARRGNTLNKGAIMPQYPAPDGTIKLSAAWLIEHAGFAKGYSCGRVGISSRQALALINRGGATAEELLNLMRDIQSAVRSAFGIDLVPEPEFVGFD
jgi:UDP-N-acetylmuramate dehydrogenase